MEKKISPEDMMRQAMRAGLKSAGDKVKMLAFMKMSMAVNKANVWLQAQLDGRTKDDR